FVQAVGSKVFGRMGRVALAAEIGEFILHRLNRVGRGRSLEWASDFPGSGVGLEMIFLSALLDTQLLDVFRLQLAELVWPVGERILVQRVVNILLDREDSRRGFQLGEVFLLARSLLADQNLLGRLLGVGEGYLRRQGGLRQTVGVTQVLGARRQRHVLG